MAITGLSNYSYWSTPTRDSQRHKYFSGAPFWRRREIRGWPNISSCYTRRNSRNIASRRITCHTIRGLLHLQKTLTDDILNIILFHSPMPSLSWAILVYYEEDSGCRWLGWVCDRWTMAQCTDMLLNAGTTSTAMWMYHRFSEYVRH